MWWNIDNSWPPLHEMLQCNYLYCTLVICASAIDIHKYLSTFPDCGVLLQFQHRLLLQKYGRSGAGKIPDSEALTEGEILCLRFWGIEASGCKYCNCVQ